MSCIAIIPARGGSKRIPRKNIKLFAGKPIIGYSIDVALRSKLFDEVMVSTDDDEIAQYALKYGAKVPFKRSDINSNDFATTIDVITEVITKYQNSGRVFDFICCIYPTAPFIESKDLITGYNLIKTDDFEAVIPVTEFSYPIQRALMLEENRIQFYWPEYKITRSQDLKQAYHDAGQWYWLKNKQSLHIFGQKTGYVIIPNTKVQDIDNPIDWDLAEIKFKLMNNE